MIRKISIPMMMVFVFTINMFAQKLDQPKLQIADLF